MAQNVMPNTFLSLSVSFSAAAAICDQVCGGLSGSIPFAARRSRL